MAKINLNTLRTKFESGDKPTGADYSDLIDTLSAQATDLGSDGNNENTIYGIESYTVLESIDASIWRFVKYAVTLSYDESGVSKFYSTELSVLIDSDGINVSEYGVIDTDGDIGTVDVSRSGDTLSLSVTPNPALRPISVRYFRTGLKA